MNERSTLCHFRDKAGRESRGNRSERERTAKKRKSALFQIQGLTNGARMCIMGKTEEKEEYFDILSSQRAAGGVSAAGERRTNGLSRADRPGTAGVVSDGRRPLSCPVHPLR